MKKIIITMLLSVLSIKAYSQYTSKITINSEAESNNVEFTLHKYHNPNEDSDIPKIKINVETETINGEVFIIHKYHNPNKVKTYILVRPPSFLNDFVTGQSMRNCSPKVKRKPYTISDTVEILPKQDLIRKYKLNALFHCQNLKSKTRYVYDYVSIIDSFEYVDHTAMPEIKRIIFEN